MQAAKKTSIGVEAANFWSSGTAGIFTASAACSVISACTVPNYSVGVSDPTQLNTGSITLTINQPATALVSSDPGVTVSQLSPTIIMSVNVNGSLGKTYHASFTVSTKSMAKPVQQSTLPSLTPTLSNWSLAGSQPTLTFSGPSGQAYRLLASPDISAPLSNWMVVTSGTFGSTPLNFTDSVSNAQRFYRLVSP